MLWTRLVVVTAGVKGAAPLHPMIRFALGVCHDLVQSTVVQKVDIERACQLSLTRRVDDELDAVEDEIRSGQVGEYHFKEFEA